MNRPTSPMTNSIKLYIPRLLNIIRRRRERLTILHTLEQTIPIPLVRPARYQRCPRVDFRFSGPDHVHAVDG